MASYSFTVPGTPTGKQRPRVTRSGHAYTPAQTVNFEAVVRATAINAGVKPIDGPVALLVTVHKAPAKSWSKRRKAEAVGWAQAKPDLDNVVKAVADALSNGVAFRDDTQIAAMHASRKWDDENETVITVSSL